MKQTRDFLRIPVNRIIALILVDIMSIVIAAFGHYMFDLTSVLQEFHPFI